MAEHNSVHNAINDGLALECSCHTYPAEVAGLPSKSDAFHWKRDAWEQFVVYYDGRVSFYRVEQFAKHYVSGKVVRRYRTPGENFDFSCELSDPDLVKHIQEWMFKCGCGEMVDTQA